MKKKCFIVQKFDGGRYDNLYEQVFKPVIESAGFEPYRVDQDPAASILIESIEKHISDSDACFVEISEDTPNVWFELGYAIAREKPLCLVCSSVRSKFPFDIQHRQIIQYSAQALPSDFATLRKRIEDQLCSLLNQEIALQENANVAKALSKAPDMNGLKAHEMLALSIIFEGRVTSSLSNWMISRDMERAGYTTIATALAITGLERKGYMKSENSQDENGDRFVEYVVTQSGEEWLLLNQDRFKLRVNPEILDEDIPF